jgi:lipopolysaccharide biosynthesis protein
MTPPAKGTRSLARRLALLAVSPWRWPEITRGLLHIATHGISTRVIQRGYAYGSFFRSHLRRRTDFIEERWSGLQSLSNASRVAVFNHYDQQGVLHDFVAYYVRQLNEAGFTVIFVSNSPWLSRDAIDRLLPCCALILRRANVGYDYGALKDGIAQIPSLERVDTLLLANDSVYGPFHPLKDLIARMDRRADVWGITDSWQTRYHLQSFFLLFNRAALHSPVFKRFWSKVRYVQDKGWIVEEYEIGLTRAFEEGGLRCASLFPFREVGAALLEATKGDHPAPADPILSKHLWLMRESVRRGVPLNGTQYFWDFLIERMGCPFLKRDLLRENLEKIPFVQYWEKVVGSASGYDTGLIARHLAATLGDRAIPDPMPPGRPRWTWYR